MSWISDAWNWTKSLFTPDKVDPKAGGAIPSHLAPKAHENLTAFSEPHVYGKLAGAASAWGKKGQAPRFSKEYVDAQRRNQAGARASQEDALSFMRDYATGKSSVSRAETRSAVDQMKRAMMAQAATSPTLNAAIQRQALYGGARLGADVAGAAGANAARERQAAVGAMAGQAGAMRGQDIGMFGAEAGWHQGQVAEEMMRKDMEAKYMQMGMNAQQAALEARRELERLRVGAYTGTAQSVMQGQAFNVGTSESYKQMWRDAMAKAAQAGGKYVAGGGGG